MHKAKLLVCLLAVTCRGAETAIVRPGGVIGGAGGGGVAPYTITLNPPSITLSVGSTSQVTATVQDSLGTLIPGAVLTWTTGNAGIASVSPAGLVTGVSAGNTSIGAGYSGVSATLLVSVTTVPVASVQMIPGLDTLQTGTTLQLTAIPKDANGVPLAGRTIIWSSNNVSVAPVNGAGLVNALAPGVATITAVSEGQSATATITVVNVPVVTVTVAPANDTVNVGANVTLVATPRDSNGTPLAGRVISWSSSNTAVATVNSSGVVHGVAPGAATITATSGGQSGTAAITVILVPVASVQVLPTSATIAVGATRQYTATPRDAGGNALTGRIVTWASADPTIASVSGSGLVSGVAVGGPNQISATSEGKIGTAAATVAMAPPTLVRVILTPDTTTIFTGATKQFTVQGKMSDSSLQAVSVTYAAAGGAISQSGLYTAGATPGTFNVIATVQGQTLADTSRVTLVQPPLVPVASVTIAPASANVAVGGTTTLTATPRDSNGVVLTGRTITWSSANPAIATVNASGVVTGVAVGGPVTMTAATGGQNGTAAITVIVVPVASVQVSPTTASIAVGAGTKLTATPRDSNGTALIGRPITWSSANGAIASVDTAGNVLGIAAGGPITITASSGGKSGTSAVTVTGPAATLVRVILLPDTVTVLSGGTTFFTAQGKMSDSSIQPVSVTFAVGGGTISQGGLYTAGGTTGIFNVIATAQGAPKADTSRVTIAAAPPPGSYTTVVANDWSSYGSSAVFLSSYGWGQSGASSLFTVPANVTLVPDPIFGQVVSMRQPKDTSTTGCCGWTPLKFVGFPRLLDKAWFRVKVRFSPGFTPIGPYPSGAANSYKLLFMLWQGYSERAEIEFSNGTQYIIGFSFQGVSCSSTSLPKLGGGITSVSNEWTSGEWFEYIMYYEKTGPNAARMRFWKRQLSQSGAINPGPWYMQGEDVVNCSNATPQARAINLGGNKNKTTPADQYVFWGPFEVVDGLQYPNPFGVGP